MKNLLKQIPPAPDGLRMTNIEEESAQFPGIAVLGGKMFLHYQEFSERHDTLKVKQVKNGLTDKAEIISGEGEVLYPVSLTWNHCVWFAWSETCPSGWSIRARNYNGCEWSETVIVAEGEALLYPCLYSWRDGLWLMWTEQGKNRSVIRNARWNGEAFDEAECVTKEGEAFCGNACEGGDGYLYLTYDAYLDGAYHGYVQVRTESGWGDAIRIDDRKSWVCQPRIAREEGGATICWYTFDYGAEFGVYSIDVHLKGEKAVIENRQTLIENVGWYMNLSLSANTSGLQILSYTWGKDRLHVRYRRNGGDWSLPAQMSYEDVHCAMYPSIAVGEDETVGLAWQFAYRNGHYERNAAIVLTRFTPDLVDTRADASVEFSLNAFQQPIPTKKEFDRHSEEAVRNWLSKNGYQSRLLFGDIHGQSGISDGMGRIDQYYRKSQDKADLQISCLTDHDCYPDWISQSEWELMRTTARLMDEDEKMTVLLSYEWTPNEFRYDFGHKNVYYMDDNGDIFRSGERAGATPTDLYNSIRGRKALCIPHHPAADWGMVSAATDWLFHDEEVERLAEIYSRHASYECTESISKYTKNIKKFPKHCVQDALKKGYHLGFTAGSDSHQMEHGIEGGIVAVYADSHTREGVWKGMYDRHTYGTTGARILLSLKVNGQMMGSELVLPEKESVHLEISVLGTKNVKVELLKNNRIIAAWKEDSHSCERLWVDNERGEEDCYYVRITQSDEHMAWSSPVWVSKEV